MAVSRINEAGLNINQYGNRNLIINGAMRVAQRGTSATGLGTSPDYFTVDRFRFADSANPPARYTQTQSTDAPDGFSNSLKMEVTTTDSSVDADEVQNIDQFIEAQDLQHLNYGSSSAKTITLSFYVKCSVAQTFGVRLQHEDGGGGYSQSYTINATNTWERKTLTFSGNTATAFNNDNGRGFRIRWGLCAGSNFTGSDSTAWGNGATFGQHENTWLATSGATWQLTGCQLEVGDTATDFEHRTFADELRRCQRYYFRLDGGSADSLGFQGQMYTTTNAQIFGRIPTMRAAPTPEVSAQSGVSTLGGTIVTLSSPSFTALTTDSFRLSATTSSSITAGTFMFLRVQSSQTGYIDFDAEL